MCIQVEGGHASVWANSIRYTFPCKMVRSCRKTATSSFNVSAKYEGHTDKWMNEWRERESEREREREILHDILRTTQAVLLVPY